MASIDNIKSKPRFDISLVPGDQIVLNTTGTKPEEGPRPRRKYFVTIDGKGYPIITAEEREETTKKKRG